MQIYRRKKRFCFELTRSRCNIIELRLHTARLLCYLVSIGHSSVQRVKLHVCLGISARAADTVRRDTAARVTSHIVESGYM